MINHLISVVNHSCGRLHRLCDPEHPLEQIALSLARGEHEPRFTRAVLRPQQKLQVVVRQSGQGSDYVLKLFLALQRNIDVGTENQPQVIRRYINLFRIALQNSPPFVIKILLKY
jgi:hypothetical protein